MYRRGFAPIIFLVIAAIAAAGKTIFAYKSGLINKIYNSGKSNVEVTSQTEIPLSTQAPTSSYDSSTETVNSPTATATPSKKTPTPTPRTTNSPTPTGNVSCSYDLNSPTGAIQLILQPQTGYITGTPYAELKATAGCKVLDGRSTDTQNLIGSQGNPKVIYSSVPPGSYTARISYGGSWTEYKSVTVSSGQSSYLYFPISGDHTPTPAPTPTPNKPQCSTPVLIPSGGSAPLSVKLYLGSGGGPTNDYKYTQWDLTGDGSWDVTVNFGDVYTNIYQKGSYTIKGRIQNTGGVYSDPCQTSLTVN